MSDRDEAKTLVDAFAARGGGNVGVWAHITRADLAAGLKERLDDPDKINQGSASLCGPADFFWDLATDRPKEYAKAGIELWEQGWTTIGTLKIKPGQDLKSSSLPASLNAADWVTLASLRDGDNILFDYQSTDDEFSGITMPSGLEDWLTKAGYTTVVNDTNVYFSKDVANAREASRLRSLGYRVCLFISANMLDTATQNDSSTTPDHWIILLGSIDFTGATTDPNSTVKFRVFTWGSARDVPQTGTLRIPKFLDNYYGYVACKL